MKVLGLDLAVILVSALLLSAAVLGPLFFISMPMEHGGGCPFMPGQVSMCSMTALDHIEYWQSAFTFILFEVLTFAAVALVLLFGFPPIQGRGHSPPRPIRILHPTLFQELFSRGLLNPKLH